MKKLILINLNSYKVWQKQEMHIKKFIKFATDLQRLQIGNEKVIWFITFKLLLIY